MEVLGFIFGIFGLMAYLQIGPLKNRIEELERELTKIKGTSYHEDRTSLISAARSYIGKKVRIELKEDHEDIDIINNDAAGLAGIHAVGAGDSLHQRVPLHRLVQI